MPLLQYFEAMYPDRDLLIVDFLSQDPKMPGAAVFSIHNDSENGDVNPLKYDIDITVCLKLTAGPSAMQVMGCHPTEYPDCAGGYVAFRSSAEHQSIRSNQHHLKMVLFFGRRSDDHPVQEKKRARM
jgi:hypothetical protein